MTSVLIPARDEEPEKKKNKQTWKLQLSWDSLPTPTWSLAQLSSGRGRLSPSGSHVAAPEQHSVGAQAVFSGHPNAASHHFKSVPLNYFADRLMYLVLWFLS